MSCDRCGHSIYVHRLRGPYAYCDPEATTKDARACFTVTEVNTVRRALGHPISYSALDLERQEAEE